MFVSRALPLIAATLFPAPALADSVTTDPIRVNPDLIAELVYGIYCAQDPVRTEAAPETASGVINIVPDLPAIRFVQTTVPAALGIGFGILSRAPDGMVHDPVTVTVTHPPFPGSGIAVERWTTRLDGVDFNLTGFSFDVPGELVPGIWTFSAHAGQTELFHVTFEVVPSDLAPGVLAECQMAFTS
jgi:hypothetical protein